ncbi:MAG: iron ABC transporter permease [Proteobacteria bacterium]|nr:iron ABC transporter permease [Pseudomonadota bacterium]MBU1648774.1 iron ABC transporter permease [Pseudomonadota bacterium]MBU1986340.1 iron ABC transporter permease [Pseudomonadota bacterium]
MSSKSPFILMSLALFLVLAIILATGMGFLAIAPLEVIQVVWAKVRGIGIAADINPTFPFVIMEVRLPRILAAAFVGGGLAVAGAVFQAILLNPLADPYTLGVSSGAAFGASLALVLGILGITVPLFFSVPLFAFLGAMTTLIVVFALAAPDGRLSSNTLILSGVIVAAILSAGIGFIKYLADEQVGVIIFWLMGSFVGKTWSDVTLTAIFVFPGLLLTLYFARDLNIMALGGRTADTLGVDSRKVKKILLVCASLMTAICVSVSGIIGFVGLIIPHLLRLVLGPDNRLLIPACFFGGAILLLTADTITRAWLPTELPIGVLTSLIGGPFFCYIFRKKQLGQR